MAQVFACEFCEFSKNIFSYRKPPVGASNNYISFTTKKEKSEIL